MRERRVTDVVRSDLLERARWEDVPRWSAWVELRVDHPGSQTQFGVPACWLPWNLPSRRKSQPKRLKR
jgi:hypothetical protein